MPSSFDSMIWLRNLTSYFFLRRLCCALTTFRHFYRSLTGIPSFLAVANFALNVWILSYAAATYRSQASLLRPRFFFPWPETSDPNSELSSFAFLLALASRFFGASSVCFLVSACGVTFWRVLTCYGCGAGVVLTTRTFG